MLSLPRDTAALAKQNSIVARIAFQDDDDDNSSSTSKPSFTRQSSKAQFTRQNSTITHVTAEDGNEHDDEDGGVDDNNTADNSNAANTADNSIDNSKSAQSSLTRQSSKSGGMSLKRQGSRLAALSLTRQASWLSRDGGGPDEVNAVGGFDAFSRPKLGRQVSASLAKEFEAKASSASAADKAFFEKTDTFAMPIVRQASKAMLSTRNNSVGSFKSSLSFRSTLSHDEEDEEKEEAEGNVMGINGSNKNTHVVAGTKDNAECSSGVGVEEEEDAAAAENKSVCSSIGPGSITAGDRTMKESSRRGIAHQQVQEQQLPPWHVAALQRLEDDASAITNPTVVGSEATARNNMSKSSSRASTTSGGHHNNHNNMQDRDDDYSESVITNASSKPRVWHCHCCTAKNGRELSKCRVCGRPESYAMQSYAMPLHGKNSALFRPSQLLTAMEDVHSVDSERWTALHTACQKGNLLQVKAILELKGKVEVTTNKGFTPLHMATHAGSLGCVKELLKHKAATDVHSTFEKQTPLHIACEKGFGEIAQVLLLHGAQVNVLNALARTPLHGAAICGRVDIGTLLLRAGANAHALDAHGWNACQIAELFGHRLMQELIIRATMNIKQAVISELPTMPWHSPVWTEVANTQIQKMKESIVAEERNHDDELLRERILREKKDSNMMELRVQRREEVRKQIAYKASMESRYSATRGGGGGDGQQNKLPAIQ